jgi:hypothetical protein
MTKRIIAEEQDLGVSKRSLARFLSSAPEP